MKRCHINKWMQVGAAGLVIAFFGAVGCSEIVEVENPGLIGDETLNAPEMMAALVTGMSADFSRAMNEGGSEAFPSMSLELTSGHFNQEAYIAGVVTADLADPWWNAMQRSRWVATAGLERMRTVLGAQYDTSPLAARANMFAGFSNRLLGENVCHTVIDGGPAQPRERHFELAEEFFTEAIRIATASGAEDIHRAALGGRASVRAWQGNWSGAVADASLVPVSFRYEAAFSPQGVINNMFNDAFLAYYVTVHRSRWQDVEDDPRVRWRKITDPQGQVLVTRGGGHEMWAPLKYPDRGSNMPITHGPEMLVLRAEAALREGDLAGMTASLNGARAHWGMDPVSEPGNSAEAWELLKHERAATLWLERRQFWDLARWYEEGLDNRMEGRARCIPIGRSEVGSNPNLAEFR